MLLKLGVSMGVAYLAVWVEISFLRPCAAAQVPANVAGMILSPAPQPILARLVRCILAGEFFEMRELLADSISLHNQLESVHGPLHSFFTPGSLWAHILEVLSLLSWVYCFAAYVAITHHQRYAGLHAPCHQGGHTPR